MQIGKNTVVTVNYALWDAQGALIEDGREPLVYLHGGYGNTLLKIEEALEGQHVGYESTIQIEPAEAFGDYDPELLKIESRSSLPSPLEVGMQLEGTPVIPGDEAPLIFTVTDIAEDKVVLDGNHPLAGMALRFMLRVMEVRAATDEEIAHGHAYAAQGYHQEMDDVDEAEGDQFRSVTLH